MQWLDVRRAHPDQWLVIEALAAHTSEGRRFLDEVTVIETCESGEEALSHYRQLHKRHPDREFYFVHTSREALDIREQRWLGLRGNRAAYPA